MTVRGDRRRVWQHSKISGYAETDVSLLIKHVAQNAMLKANTSSNYYVLDIIMVIMDRNINDEGIIPFINNVKHV